MGQRGFGSLTPDVILAQLMHLYGKQSIPELNQALSRLQEPMDRAAPIEVMLRDIEEVQMFLQPTLTKIANRRKRSSSPMR